MPYCATTDGKCGPDHVAYGLFIMFILTQLTLVLVYWVYLWIESGEYDARRGSYLSFMNKMQKSSGTKMLLFGHALVTLLIATASAAFDWEAFMLCGASFAVAIKASISITSPQNFGRKFAIDVDYDLFQK